MRNFEFPPYTNAQINAALLADKLNELIDAWNAEHPERKPDNAFTGGRTLKEGVTLSKSGTYMLNNRFIKKEDAYAV